MLAFAQAVEMLWSVLSSWLLAYSDATHNVLHGTGANAYVDEATDTVAGAGT